MSKFCAFLEFVVCEEVLSLFLKKNSPTRRKATEIVGRNGTPRWRVWTEGGKRAVFECFTRLRTQPKDFSGGRLGEQWDLSILDFLHSTHTTFLTSFPSPLWYTSYYKFQWNYLLKLSAIIKDSPSAKGFSTISCLGNFQNWIQSGCFFYTLGYLENKLTKT